ncbi:MAG: sugar ABC transporter substrate-binding protein [Candidatus Rokuibacteriota bacterium]|nr:MAG: sugar ABC transporter substrate-binding protein [Candidatus Rokubacteria bacterium]
MRRREFLKTTGLAAGVAATGLESIVAARRAPAHAQGTRLHILRWVDFIPEADVELKRQAPEASKALGAEVVFEFINFNDLQPRITAAVQSGAGADIIMMLYNWPHLYASALVDVSDVAEPIGKAQKGYYDVFNVTSKVDGKWLAVPHGIVGNAIAYRRSWHTEIGVKEFPQTWDEWREVGRKLKAKGKPVGQALGHSAGDPPTFAYPLLWSFGGAEVDRTGKKVVINSKGAVEAVKFMQAFWKDACDEGGLAWDDTSNNRAFHSGEISATLNGASIYIVAKRQREKIRDEKGEPMVQDIEHAALLPKGPAGQFALYVPFQHSVMKYSKNMKLAKDFVKWLHQKENYERWFQVNEGYSVGSTKTWEEHPMWSRIDRPLQVFRQAARQSRMLGYPGPASAKATESYTKYIVVDMFAKAVQGMKAEDAVKWAEGELSKIYEG